MTGNDWTTSLPPDAEIAAGGLVWRSRKNGVLLGVVRREKRSDWSLPKGRPKKNDASLSETAKREAMEELSIEVDLGEFAGSYSYLKDGKPKVVLMWHMTGLDQPSDKAADQGEILTVEWLTPGDAIARLSHPTEKDFVARHGMRENSRGEKASLFKRLWSHIRKHPELDRLEVGMESAREQFHAAIARGLSTENAWLVLSVERSLDRAEKALRARKSDIGWGAVQDAQRFLVFAMSDQDLVSRALSLRAEAANKLGKWRKDATAELFASIPADVLKTGFASSDQGQFKNPEREKIRSVVAESLSVLNENGQNSYHRIRLVGQQLRYLIWIGCGLLGALLLIVPGLDFEKELNSSGRMFLAVALFGGVGATVTALYQLSRAGDAKIPESTLHGVITLGRPLVGALSALAIYVILRSGLISLIRAKNVTVATALTLAFVSGFSERLIVQTVATVTGDGSAGGTPPNREAKT